MTATVELTETPRPDPLPVYNENLPAEWTERATPLGVHYARYDWGVYLLFVYPDVDGWRWIITDPEQTVMVTTHPHIDAKAAMEAVDDVWAAYLAEA